MMLRKGEIKLPDPMAGVRRKFEALLAEAAGEIISRTGSGKTIDGKSFKQYTKRYAAFREKKGRKTSPPDLTFTGRMLESISSKVTKATPDFIEGRITIAPKHKAKAEGNQKRRPFFGLSKKQIEYINQKIGDAIYGGK